MTLGPLLDFLTRRAFLLAYVGGVVVLLVGLVITHSNRDYNSDDVALQTILGFWEQGYHNQAFVPFDNYIIKMPIYAVLESAIPAPRSSLLAATVLFNLSAFTMFAIGSHYLWRECLAIDFAVPKLALLWLATLGSGFYEIVISPNTRNLEIGLAVLSLAGFALYLERGLQWGHVRNRLVVIGTAALLGVFMYSAAYYLIFVLAPLGLLLSVNMAVSGLDRRQVRLLLFLAASAVVSVVCRGILDQVGWVQKGEPVRFVTADQIGFHLQLLLESGLTIFGANFLGHRVLSFDSVRSIAQLSILVPILASPIWLSKKYRLSDQIWRYYFALLPYFVALAFVFTSYVGDFESRRYLVILPFAAAVTVAFVYQDLSEPRLRKLLALSLVMNIVLGIYSVGSKIDASDPRNVRSAETISLVRSVGLEKGYTHFWLSNINTYLTRNDVAFIQVVCVEERLRFYPWLTDDGILEKPAQSTFYLYDARSEDIVDCTPERLINQLGDPAQILAIDKSTTLAIYDYDISTKFDEHGGD